MNIIEINEASDDINLTIQESLNLTIDEIITRIEKEEKEAEIDKVAEDAMDNIKYNINII